jgi:hypothetical protein
MRTLFETAIPNCEGGRRTVQFGRKANAARLIEPIDARRRRFSVLSAQPRERRGYPSALCILCNTPEYCDRPEWGYRSPTIANFGSVSGAAIYVASVAAASWELPAKRIPAGIASRPSKTKGRPHVCGGGPNGSPSGTRTLAHLVNTRHPSLIRVGPPPPECARGGVSRVPGSEHRSCRVRASPTNLKPLAQHFAQHRHFAA